MRQIPRLKIAHADGYPLLGCLVATSLLIFIGQLIEIRIQQREIEDNGRKLIGLYMHDVVKPGERIYLEPLGYIGYYSDRYIIDWPGLGGAGGGEIASQKRDGSVYDNSGIDAGMAGPARR